MSYILGYGSSTTYGYSAAPEGLGYIDQLKYHYMAESAVGKPPVDVINHGRSLRTVDDAYNNLPTDINFQKNRRRGLIAICGFGLVESFSDEDGKHVISKPDYRAKLQMLGQRALDHHVKLLIVGVTPVDERGTRPINGGRFSCSNDDRLAYDEINQEFAADIGAPYVPLWDSLGGKQVGDSGYMSRDFLHVNALGHAVIFDLVLPEVEKLRADPDPIKPLSSIPSHTPPESAVLQVA